MIQALVMVGLHLAARPELATLYRSARSYDKATFRFAPPSDDSLGRTRTLLAHLVRALAPGAPPPALVAEARAVGLELGLARDAGGELWVLHEPAGQRAGAGFYALRPGGGPLVIQAPHTFFDEGTGDIALSLFARLRAGGLFFNTVHRYSSPGEAAGNPADVAHAERTLFAAANQGLLETGRWTIVQVHGFGERQGLPAGVRAVVADGAASRPPDAPAVRLRAALARRWGAGAVRLYGVDADVLGATTNVQARAARRAGVPFLHIELAAQVRAALVRDVTPLADALAEGLRDPTGAHR